MPQPVKFSPEDKDLAAHKWRLDRNGYAVRTVYVGPPCPGRSQRHVRHVAHRLVMERVLGRPLIRGKEIVDHINGRPGDSRRENLRVTDWAGNAQNRSTGPFRGTTWNKRCGKWQASVHHKERNYHCGVFIDRFEAGRAAGNKRRELGFLSGHLSQGQPRRVS